MFLSKAKGGSGIGPHWWDEDGAVIEVPDELGREILRIPGHDFTEQAGPAEKPKPAAAPKTTEVKQPASGK